MTFSSALVRGLIGISTFNVDLRLLPRTEAGAGLLALVLAALTAGLPGAEAGAWLFAFWVFFNWRFEPKKIQIPMSYTIGLACTAMNACLCVGGAVVGEDWEGPVGTALSLLTLAVFGMAILSVRSKLLRRLKAEKNAAERRAEGQ